jgi:hypothetical protein
LPLGEGLVDGGGRFLQIGYTRVTDAVVGCDLVDALGEGRLLAREALLHLGPQLHQFVEDELDVGIHGTELRLLTAGVVDVV